MGWPEHGARSGPSAAFAIAALALAFVVVVAAACSESNNRLSGAELVERADAICDVGRRDGRDLNRRVDPASKGAPLIQYLDASIALLRRQVDDLAALRGPVGRDATLRRAVRALRSASNGLRALRDAAEHDVQTLAEATQSNPAIVDRINGASARANVNLLRLGFDACVTSVSG
jgi:hypothetical protein